MYCLRWLFPHVEPCYPLKAFVIRRGEIILARSRAACVMLAVSS